MAIEFHGIGLMVSECVCDRVFCAQAYYFFKLFRLLPCGPRLPIPNPSFFVLLIYTMGQGAAKKRQEEAKAQKQQTVSAASAESSLPPASSLRHAPDNSLNIPKKRGCPRKNPVETVPPRPLPCHTTHSTNTTLSASASDVSDISEPDDRLPIEMIASGILQTSAGGGDSEISSADNSDFSNPWDVEDIVHVDDGSDSDESILVVAKKSGCPGKAAKKPSNAR